MPRLMLATTAVALCLPLVPAHADGYHVKHSCSFTDVGPADHDRRLYLITGTATATSELAAVAVSTTIRCTFYSPGWNDTIWTGAQALPGAASAVGGYAIAYPDVAVCSQGAATFSDGTTVETAPC